MDCSYDGINKMLKLSNNISYTKIDKFTNKSNRILNYENEPSYYRKTAKYANYRYELLEQLMNNTKKHILYFAFYIFFDNFNKNGNCYIRTKFLLTHPGCSRINTILYKWSS